jgi:hypothetical protein
MDSPFFEPIQKYFLAVPSNAGVPLPNASNRVLGLTEPLTAATNAFNLSWAATIPQPVSHKYLAPVTLMVLNAPSKFATLGRW